ncbi:MAG: hypothetical protein PVF45_03125 [Anaerolineae bacterium]|jgi:hypothetical protein
MSIRKASVLELATYAYELEAGVLRGVLRRGPNGTWMVDDTPLDEFLTAYTGQSMVFIAASLEDERPMQLKTCRICGRQYRGIECADCSRARRRLRGW